MTSLSMPGFSLSLLLLPGDGDSEGYSSKQILSLLDAPASAPGWKYYAATEPGVVSDEKEQAAEVKAAKEVDLARTFRSSRIVQSVEADS